MTTADHFSREVRGLALWRPPGIVDLADGDHYTLRIAPVAKRIGDATVRMLAYNGSIPGPTLRVPEGAEVDITVENHGDLETTVHWHGLRLENRADGTLETQAAIPVGGSFDCRVAFPDPGAYWYHPHIREDYGQELGLYGNVVVTPADPGYWAPANRELTITLDDVLIEAGQVAPFSRTDTTHAAMGRFGNVFLVNGETDPPLRAQLGEVVRLYLLNAANTRVFNVAIPGARLKVAGGDSGRCEREQFADEILLSPSERAVVDVLFDAPGDLPLEHRTPGHTYTLATITVSGDTVAGPHAAAFEQLRTDPELSAERERLAPLLDAEPDTTVAFVAHMDMSHGEEARDDHGLHHEHAHGGPAPIEWEDEMVEMNRMTTQATMRWQLVDPATGRLPEWRFVVGDRVKIRLINELESDHPMHHPFHIHGAGRFVVLARDGVAESNLAWSDTVLVTTGETVDIVLDVTNPGLWMAHCHIAEHNESGMTFSFHVERAQGG